MCSMKHARRVIITKATDLGILYLDQWSLHTTDKFVAIVATHVFINSINFKCFSYVSASQVPQNCKTRFRFVNITTHGRVGRYA